MSYTIKQLEAAIEDESTEWEGSWDEFGYVADSSTKWTEVDADYPDARQMKDGSFYAHIPLEVAGVAIPGIGQARTVEDFGGKGQGENRWIVFKVTNAEGERLFRKSGYYASFYGTDWDGELEEVVAKEKTVTVFEAV